MVVIVYSSGVNYHLHDEYMFDSTCAPKSAPHQDPKKLVCESSVISIHPQPYSQIPSKKKKNAKEMRNKTTPKTQKGGYSRTQEE